MSVFPREVVGPDGLVRVGGCGRVAVRPSQCRDGCGSPCRCPVAGPPCSGSIVNEFHIRWSGGQMQVVFMHQAPLCCDQGRNFLHFEAVSARPALGVGGGCRHRSAAAGYGTPGPPAGPTIEVFHERSGFQPATQITNPTVFCGALGFSVARLVCYDPINAGTPPFDGEWVSTRHEDRGWATAPDASGTMRSAAWRGTSQLDEGDPCRARGCWACCLRSGVCVERDAPGCAALGGRFFEGRRCGGGDDGSRPPCAFRPVGACCIPGGGCSQTNGYGCDGLGGVWLGPGIPCGPGVCPEPVGGCCFPSGECAALGLTGCLGGGGVFQGAGSGCSPNPCPGSSPGACCFSNGACQVTTQNECLAAGGAFGGANTVCDQATCPTGGCCLADGSCEVLSALGCSQRQGYYYGDGAPCPGGGGPCGGACCHPANIPPCQILPLNECLAQQGGWCGYASGCTSHGCPGGCQQAGGGESLRVQHFLMGMLARARHGRLRGPVGGPHRERIIRVGGSGAVRAATGAEVMEHGCGGTPCGGDARRRVS